MMKLVNEIINTVFDKGNTGCLRYSSIEFELHNVKTSNLPDSIQNNIKTDNVDLVASISGETGDLVIQVKSSKTKKNTIYFIHGI